MFACQYNTEKGTFVFPVGGNMIFSMEDLICFYEKEEDQRLVWGMFNRVQTLDMTVEERSIAGALVLMNAGKNFK